jgi:curved DNA-binding protein CbpA
MVLGGVMDKAIRNYYEVLGIEKTAAPEEIKRAYFGKVRQFPPERFPEEFKELRTAYDTISDKAKRAEYDESGALPEAILPLLYHARAAGKKGNYGKAAELFKTILQIHPELDKVRQEYAWTLEEDGKNGKATEVWEYLCEQRPANAEYARDLAASYNNRGWRKKALPQYRKALELDKSDSQSWLAFLEYHVEANEMDEARAICIQALDAVGENGHIGLYFAAFTLFEKKSQALTEKSLQYLVRKAREKQHSEDEFEEIVFRLLTHIEEEESIQFYPYIKELAAMLLVIDDGLKKRLGWVERNYEITNIEKKGFNSLLHDVLLIKNNDGDSDSKKMRNHVLNMEYILLSKKDIYYPQLRRLKKEYPDLYNLHKNFFDEALAADNTEKMMLQRTKALAKQKLQPTDFDEGDEGDWEPVETVRRESPKVGRNDPCPCGSGKKYKKCCGA